jgi:hypothetical protein
MTRSTRDPARRSETVPTDATGCTIVESDGTVCSRPVEHGAPVPLCTTHLLVAYDWVARDAGVTDVLPGACLVCGSRLGVRYPSGWLCAICDWRFGEVPDPELERPRVDVVYYIRYRAQVKIGTTGNPHARLAQLPHDEVLAFERGGRALEQRRHAQFAGARYAGTEWFLLHDELMRHVRELGAGVEDPWDRYARWISAELALRR